MTVTVTATAGSASANSYLTVAAADAIANTMVGTLAWGSATTDDKGPALITATNGLETLSWTGTRATSTQALSWPRVDASCGDKEIADDDIPREIELACFDLANALLGDPTLLRSTPGAGELVTGVPNRDLRRLKLDVMELEWREFETPSGAAQITPLTALPHLASILGCLTTSGTGSGRGKLCALERS